MLAFDTNNFPYVAYRLYDNSQIYVKRYNGSSWVNVGGTTVWPAATSNMGFTVYNNTPYVSFLDAKETIATTVKLNASGTTWETVISATFGQSKYVANFAFNNGVPYFAFSDLAAAYKLSLLKCNGTSWEKVGESGFSAISTNSCFFDFYKNTPYVAYNQTFESKLNVMKFVSETSTGIDFKSIEPNVKTYPNPTNGKFSITIENAISKSYDIQINNTVGELISKRTSVTEKNNEFDLSNYPKGVYLIQIKADKQIIGHKIVRQ